MARHSGRTVGDDILTEIYRNPAGVMKQFAFVRDDHAMRFEVVNLVSQTVWDRHILALAPKLGVFARGRGVMQDQEVSDPFILRDRERVVLVCQKR